MRLRSSLRLVPWLLAFALFAGCKGQGEGQVCSTQNGNADCAGGLFCKLGLPGVIGDRCCPANVGQSTTAVCGVHQGGLEAGTDTPVDTGEAGGDAETGDATGITLGDATVPAPDAAEGDSGTDGSAE